MTLKYFLLMFISYAYAQEMSMPIFTQYLADNPFVLSPTYAGIGENVRIRGNALKQWVGIENSPQTQSIFADFRIKDRSGAGISFYNDVNGNSIQQGGKISFAHHLVLDYFTKQFLSGGISLNASKFYVDVADLVPGEPDPGITDNRQVFNTNLDVGILYRQGFYYFNANVGNILNKDMGKYDVKETTLLRNYQIYTGYVFKSKHYNWYEIEPSMFFQMREADWRSSVDLNLKYRKINKRDDYYWFGFSYRFLTDQIGKPLSFAPMGGLKKGQFYLAYSYQITLNSLFFYNTGSHMISLGLDFFQGGSKCACTQDLVGRQVYD